MKEVLERLIAASKCAHIFTHPGDPARPLGPWVLETQIGDLRKIIQTHPDAGLHGLRHTFLTEAGLPTDPFTLQYVAGHDNIKTTMRYVHPQANAVQALFTPQGGLENRRQAHRGTRRRVVTKTNTMAARPSTTAPANKLKTKQFLSAEVVKWQTHHLEGVAPKGMGVQVPPSAPFEISLAPAHRPDSRNDPMIYLFTAIHIVVCFALIVIILLQPGKGADLAGAFGGQGSQTAFGPRSAANLLTRSTTWLAAIFVITSISLTVLMQHQITHRHSVLSGSTTTQSTPKSK